MPSNIYMHFKYLHAELDHDISIVPGVRPGPGGGLQLPPPGGQLAARCPGAPDDGGGEGAGGAEGDLLLLHLPPSPHIPYPNLLLLGALQNEVWI